MSKLDKPEIAPEHTAVRVALWRGLHVLLDPPPHVFSDTLGVKLAGEEGWRDRPDMNPQFSKSMRASIVGRARFVEELVEEQARQGVDQYIILGAGLDTFAERRPELAAQLRIYEVDQPGPQEWKQRRLAELGITPSDRLHFIPVNFEAGQSWWEELVASGFETGKPAVIVSTGVSMYLSKEANLATLRQISKLTPGSTFAMTFMLSVELLDHEERGMMELVMKRAKESGAPFVSLFAPPEILALSAEAGFRNSQYVSAEEIYNRYFASRSDGLRAGSAEAFLIAST